MIINKYPLDRSVNFNQKLIMILILGDNIVKRILGKESLESTTLKVKGKYLDLSIARILEMEKINRQLKDKDII